VSLFSVGTVTPGEQDLGDTEFTFVPAAGTHMVLCNCKYPNPSCPQGIILKTGSPHAEEEEKSCLKTVFLSREEGKNIPRLVPGSTM
jgi:hypothetical protein